MSADCRTYVTFLQDSGAALKTRDASQIQKLADRADAAISTLTDPKVKEAVTKLSQSAKQQAAYMQNPSASNIPDSNLMNAANNDFAAACAPHK